MSSQFEIWAFYILPAAALVAMILCRQPWWRLAVAIPAFVGAVWSLLAGVGQSGRRAMIERVNVDYTGLSAYEAYEAGIRAVSHEVSTELNTVLVQVIAISMLAVFGAAYECHVHGRPKPPPLQGGATLSQPPRGEVAP